MSVRFQYAGDKDISVGRSGGASIFSLPGPLGNPPEGTILSTLYATTYPSAQGGQSVYVAELINSYENQNCDVNIVADGVGGSYTDWANVTNVVYKTSFIGNDNVPGSSSISTPVGNYTNASWASTNYNHDGTGGYSISRVGYFESSAGSYIGNDPSNGNGELEVPSGNNTFFAYGSFSGTNYYYDGMGGYYTSPIWVTFVSDGDFIWNDGTYDYYWTVVSTSNVSYRT
jgi:hypothetical protein